jgi:4'-phosphopantetheinyl transferase
VARSRWSRKARREGRFILILTSPLRLAADEVHIWWLDDDAERLDLTDFSAVLNASEKAQAARYVFARDRARFVLARGALRRLLAAYTASSAEALRFATGQYGKPALESCGPSYNISHSGALLLIAVAATGLAVGIDVEQHRPMCDIDSLAAVCLSSEESQVWRLLPADQKEAAFFRLWARKEAWLKASGDGLARPLQSITVGLGPQPALFASAQAGWSMHDLQFAPDYSAALVVAHPSPDVSITDLRSSVFR